MEAHSLVELELEQFIGFGSERLSIILMSLEALPKKDGSDKAFDPIMALFSLWICAATVAAFVLQRPGAQDFDIRENPSR